LTFKDVRRLSWREGRKTDGLVFERFYRKQLGVVGTTRNWSTVKKIVEFVETTK